MSNNSSHFNSLINMVKCIGLPCANDFFIDNNNGIYTDQNRTIQKKSL